MKVGKVEKLVLPEVGHFAPFEIVDECAEASAEWLGRWIERWVKEEEVIRKKGSRKSDGEMRRVNEEWKAMVKKDPMTSRPMKGARL